MNVSTSRIFQFMVKFRNSERIDQIEKLKDKYYKDHPEAVGNDSAFYRMVFLEGIKSLNNKANQNGKNTTADS